MADRAAVALRDLIEYYELTASRPAFEDLYEDLGPVGHVLAVLHLQLNTHFIAINGRATSTRHYWADNSRDLIALISRIDEDLRALRITGTEVSLDQRYREALDRCEPWLSASGGSVVPDDFKAIEIVKYDPVFIVGSGRISAGVADDYADLRLIGEGSFAFVYSYIDPHYDHTFAVKRAKKDIGAGDLQRFKREFEVMKGLSFPYILDVFAYDESRNQYRMEYCESTLRAYINSRGRTLGQAARKRIALQFLYGINYLHAKKLLHRDISLQNVLLKVYESGAVLVKLSDFGLVKEATSEFTRVGTEVRGTIIDPMLSDFRSYNVANEIYAVGWVLAFVFTGKESLDVGSSPIASAVQRCTAAKVADRYTTVAEIIAEVESLSVALEETSA